MKVELGTLNSSVCTFLNKKRDFEWNLRQLLDLS